MRQKGFTLVEMMVAVTILAIGIVMILRSLLGAVATLDQISNRITALSFLESRMNIFEQEAIKEKGLRTGCAEEKVFIASRPALLGSKIETIEIASTGETEKSRPTMDQVNLTVSWREGDRDRDVALSTYLPNKSE